MDFPDKMTMKTNLMIQIPTSKNLVLLKIHVMTNLTKVFPPKIARKRIEISLKEKSKEK